MKKYIRLFMALFLVLFTTRTFAQSHILPFFEWWNQGTFAYNDWELVPPNTNWTISTIAGNPWPSADFTSSPVQNNYSLSLETPLLYTWYHYSCAKFWCDFDYKLVNLNSTGNEKLFIDIFIGGEWKTRDSLSNTGDKDWTPMHVFLSESSDTVFKVRFRAEGANSADILHWYIDNIAIYAKCNPPVGLVINDITDRQVSMTWHQPECGTDGTGPDRSIPGYGETTSDHSSYDTNFLGYNLYRSDYNLITFVKLNTNYIIDTNYIDHVPGYQEYCYYVTSVFDLPYRFTCQSDSSNLACAEVVNGIHDLDIGKISVYPNPACDIVVFADEIPITGMELFDFTGKKILSLQGSSEKEVKVDISELVPGIYFARIWSGDTCTIKKITVLH